MRKFQKKPYRHRNKPPVQTVNPRTKLQDAQVVCWFARQHIYGQDPNELSTMEKRAQAKDRASEIYVRSLFAVAEFRAKYPEYNTIEEIVQYVRSNS
jgi:hypothetical protein